MQAEVHVPSSSVNSSRPIVDELTLSVYNFLICYKLSDAAP